MSDGQAGTATPTSWRCCRRPSHPTASPWSACTSGPRTTSATIAAWGIKSFAPDPLRHSTRPLLDWLEATGCTRIAIHFDVDSIDGNGLVLGLGAVLDGLTSNQVRRIVVDVTAAADVPGWRRRDSRQMRMFTWRPR